MAQQDGIQFWTTHSLDKVFMDSQRPPRACGQIRICAARGEVEDAQIAVRTPAAAINEARFEISDLKGPSGARIDAGCVEACWQWFIHVPANPSGSPDPAMCLRQAPEFFPDGFIESPSVHIPPARTQPLWVSVRVPREAVPGTYRGTVRLALEVEKETLRIEVPLTLEVLPFELPRENGLRHTEWFFNAVLAYYYRVKPWSEEHWGWIEKVARDMGRHRQDMIITYFQDSPPAMVGLVPVVRRRDGSLKLDFSRLDRWIDTFSREGVTWIEGGHIALRVAGWDSPVELIRFPVTDESGAPIDTSKEAMPEEEFEKIMEGMLRGCYEHLKARGLLDRFVQHISDEPAGATVESYCRISDMVRRAMPGVKRIDAVATHGLDGFIECSVMTINRFTEKFHVDPPCEVWSYECLTPSGWYPNRFIDYASIRNRITFWLSWTRRLDGFLHYGYNYWLASTGVPGRPRISPWTDATGASFYCSDQIVLPSGDPFLVYPGENSICSSIRWEVVRKGMEDYEYLRMLEELAGAGRGPARREAEALLDEVRQVVAPDPLRHTRDAALLLGTRERIGRAICALI